MGDSSEPLSPQSTKINQRQACLSADLFLVLCNAPPQAGRDVRGAPHRANPGEGGRACSCKVVGGNKIAASAA